VENAGRLTASVPRQGGEPSPLSGRRLPIPARTRSTSAARARIGRGMASQSGVASGRSAPMALIVKWERQMIFARVW